MSQIPPAGHRLCLLLLAFVLVSGCDSGAGAIGITGSWEGTVYDPDVADATRYAIELTLRDTGQRVTGSGRVDLSDGPFLFSVVSGSFLNGAADLELLFDSPPFMGRIAANLTQMDPAELTGTISARGDANGRLVIELVAR